MKLNRLSSLGSIVLLSATDGLLSSALLVVFDQVNSYYAGLRFQEELKDVERIYKETGTYIDLFDMQPEPLWWLRFAGVNVLLFIVAGLLVHRYLAKRGPSVFLLWQAVGIVVLLGWGLTMIMIEGVDSFLAGRSFHLLLEPRIRQILIGYSVGTILGNFLYAAVLHVSRKYYRASNEGIS